MPSSSGISLWRMSELSLDVLQGVVQDDLIPKLREMISAHIPVGTLRFADIEVRVEHVEEGIVVSCRDDVRVLHLVRDSRQFDGIQMRGASKMFISSTWDEDRAG